MKLEYIWVTFESDLNKIEIRSELNWDDEDWT